MSMPHATPLRPEPNWYADPQTPNLERYWDGASWTASVRPVAPTGVIPAQPVRRTNTLSIIAIVLGALSVLFFPILFGPIGLVLAGIGKSKGESLSTVALIVAGVGMLVGFGLGLLFGLAAA